MGACLSFAQKVQTCCASNIDDDDYVDGLSEEEIQLLSNATIENTPVQAYNFTSAKILDVHDGDTFQIAAIYYGQKTRFAVRLYGADTPEMSSKDPVELKAAEAATEFTQGLIAGRIIHIEVLTNKKVYDKSKRGRVAKGKFGRLLANVYIGEKSLAAELISQGHAKPYFGGSND